MICPECGSDDFDIFVDEFGDEVAYCMVCGAEYINTDDDEEWRLGPTTPFFFEKFCGHFYFQKWAESGQKVGRKWAFWSWQAFLDLYGHFWPLCGHFVDTFFWKVGSPQTQYSCGFRDFVATFPLYLYKTFLKNKKYKIVFMTKSGFLSAT